eukprot:1196174-Prorocentrum_minimum.AAC.6
MALMRGNGRPGWHTAGPLQGGGGSGSGGEGGGCGEEGGCGQVPGVPAGPRRGTPGHELPGGDVLPGHPQRRHRPRQVKGGRCN